MTSSMPRRALFVVNPAARGLPPLRQIREAAAWCPGPSEAAEIIEGGRRRRVDLGLIEWGEQAGRKAESRYFLLMAGVGLDAHIVARVSRNWKRRVGAGDYLLMGARESLFYRSRPVELLLDGR